jgi:hypothetical protein
MSDSIRLDFPGRWRAWAMFHLPFVRGTDGLTRRERRGAARRYAEMTWRGLTPEEIDRLRRRLDEMAARRDASLGG